MAGLLERVNAAASGGDESRFSIDTWISQYLIPSAGQFSYGNVSYPFGYGLPQTLAGNRVAEIAQSLPGYRMALQACPPAFAAEMVRSLVLSQARFTFRSRMSAAQPRRTFGNRDLALLEQPWVNGTTGDPYRGVNRWTLSTIGSVRYRGTENVWFTYKQAKLAGGALRAGTSRAGGRASDDAPTAARRTTRPAAATPHRP